MSTVYQRNSLNKLYKVIVKNAQDWYKANLLSLEKLLQMVINGVLTMSIESQLVFELIEFIVTNGNFHRKTIECLFTS
jgi:hypothetical protein